MFSMIIFCALNQITLHLLTIPYIFFLIPCFIIIKTVFIHNTLIISQMYTVKSKLYHKSIYFSHEKKLINHYYSLLYVFFNMKRDIVMYNIMPNQITD